MTILPVLILDHSAHKNVVELDMKYLMLKMRKEDYNVSI